MNSFEDKLNIELAYRASSSERIGPSALEVLAGVSCALLGIAPFAAGLMMVWLAANAFLGIKVFGPDGQQRISFIGGIGVLFAASLCAFATIVMFKMASRLFQGRREPRVQPNCDLKTTNEATGIFAQLAIATVQWDDECITCRHRGGLVETMMWSDLRAVLIRTTTDGPAMDDMFWVLIAENTRCVVPGESIGMEDLHEHLMKLPGFDVRAATQAMSCPDNRDFLCWEYKA